MSKIYMVVNEDRFFLSHRKPVAKAAMDSGNEVIIVTKNTGHIETIQRLGFKTIDLPINPTGMHIGEELKTFRFLYALYRKDKPDIVHHVGLKNILWGGLAAKLAGVNGVVNAVSGLGGLFNDGKLSRINRMILKVMKYSNQRSNVKVIFQNNDDLDIFLSQNVVDTGQVEFIKGSGIDLNEFAFSIPPIDNPIKIIFTGRMVKEKGVCDLIVAAEQLKSEFKGKIKFLLCGRLTPNKTGITEEYMSRHCDGEYICWLGERSDIKQLLENSHIMAFPSYYREGVPKSLIEASAIGRPIVTCDSIGCKDVVTDGINGFLVSPKDPNTLALKLRLLITDSDLRIRMGKAAREKAEKEFSIETVISAHLKIYNGFTHNKQLNYD